MCRKADGAGLKRAECEQPCLKRKQDGEGGGSGVDRCEEHKVIGDPVPRPHDGQEGEDDAFSQRRAQEERSQSQKAEQIRKQLRRPDRCIIGGKQRKELVAIKGQRHGCRVEYSGHPDLDPPQEASAVKYPRLRAVDADGADQHDILGHVQ